VGVSTLQASDSAVPGKVKHEPTNPKAQNDIKPLCASINAKKRTIHEVKTEVSDNSDIDELSLEDQLSYARIKVRFQLHIRCRSTSHICVEGTARENSQDQEEEAS
jgi:hypothetical protein